jgi:hypothetical protein
MIGAEKYNRSVNMLCPTCGESQFEYDPENLDDYSLVKCNCCQMTMTKAHLVDANSENISAHVEEIGKELVEDLSKDLKKLFAGNKFIKIT